MTDLLEQSLSSFWVMWESEAHSVDWVNLVNLLAEFQQACISGASKAHEKAISSVFHILNHMVPKE